MVSALARAAAVISTVLAICVTLAQQIGHTHEAPLALLFTNPDGSACPLPCLFGVQPGQISVAEAIQTLQRHPLTANFREVQSYPRQLSLAAQGVTIQIHFDSVNANRVVGLSLFTDKGYNNLWRGSLPVPAPRLTEALQRSTLFDVVGYFGVPTANRPYVGDSKDTFVWTTYLNRQLGFIHTLPAPNIHMSSSKLERLYITSLSDTGILYSNWSGFVSPERFATWALSQR